ncbi:MAG: Ig-like domain-containing protein [Actinomycetaceae bacterium]|nr:Ig-like domain-containing protein [Actinomycetaceae bacterium]
MSPQTPRRRVVELLLGIACVAALVIAIVNPGVHSTQVELNDAGVWVTNAERQMVAHLNPVSHSVDSALYTATPRVDLFQKGEQVFVSENESRTLSKVDVARTTLEAGITNPRMRPVVHGDWLALNDIQSGMVWRQDSATPAVVDPASAPDISGVPGAEVAFASDGTLYAASIQSRTIVSLPRDAAPGKGSVRELDVAEGTEGIQIATIGTHFVVLDLTHKQLHMPDGRIVDIPGDTVALQESGPEATSALVATSEGLLSVPFAKEEPTLKASSTPGGVAVRPARVDNCTYGAWTGTGAFLRDCGDDAHDVELKVDTLAGASHTVFRVNRSTIVLNDIDKGTLWLPDEQMLLVDDWEKVDSDLKSETEEDEDDSVDNASDIAQPERHEDNTDPTAADDELGVRPGRSNVLPVLLNDSDPDGDVLTVSEVGESDLGTVSLIRQGEALQIDVPADKSGQGEFEYTISDGRGGSAKARVRITVREPGENSAPVQTVKQSLSLGAGRTTTINALANWYDPDADPYFLHGIHGPEGFTLNHQSTGAVDITEVGHGPGQNSLNVAVSDGKDRGEGQVQVNVADANNQAPVTNADHVIVAVGASTTVAPMANDTDPNGDPLQLVQVTTNSEGVGAHINSTLGTVTLTGVHAGTYYLDYSITDGPTAATGIIRVDVVEAETQTPPTAVDDIGVLPDTGQVLVDLLANDSDPSGGVLTVGAVEIPEGSPLSVSLIDRHIARISAPRGLTQAETFTYTVSNSAGTTRATVTVVPGGALDPNAPPQLKDDILVVRSGDVAGVSVLDNDSSPGGLDLTISNELQKDIAPDMGTVFLSGDEVRVRGGATPGNGVITYTVTDSAGNVASAHISLMVIGVDPETNTAPRPRDIISRTSAGQEVTIPIPLEGIDAEGDSVSLIGAGSSPTMGALDVGASSITYTPAETAVGTDTFTYIVEDRLGKIATGTVRVGISPRDSLNHDPVAIPDEVRVRPGKKVAVAVTANDLDPDGDTVTLIPESVSDPKNQMNIGHRSGRITLTAPTTEGAYLATYSISDGAGGRATGVLTILVGKDAPLRAPIARDDSLNDTQMATIRENGSVVVNVLANDEDPDGDIAQVTVTSPDSTVTPLQDGQVEVSATDGPQLVLYTITDSDGLSSSAVIRVPGREITRPTLDYSTIPLRVNAGQRIDIPLANHVLARQGRSLSLADQASVSAGMGSDGSPLVKDSTTLTFRSLPEFSGRTSITFAVTDGNGAGDPQARTAVLTLPIDVTSTVNRPPTFRATALQVPRGGEITANLSEMASDPDTGDRLAFAMAGNAPEGITASVEGTTLRIRAAETAPEGNAGQVGVRVDDGKGGNAEASFPITVGTTGPSQLVTTIPATLTVDSGGTGTVDIANYATNPDPAAGPLKITGVTVTEGGSATFEGTVITATANEGFNDSFTVNYTVVDAAGGAERQVPGIVTVTVRGRPDPPTGVQVNRGAQPSTVQVSWTPGFDHGSPVRSFTVTDHTQGDSIRCGLTTSCSIPNRDMNTEHVFSVTATNDVGTSDPSEQRSIGLLGAPSRPATPTLSVVNGTATITWEGEASGGPEVDSYVVELSGGASTTVKAQGGGTHSATISGLAPGTSYTAHIIAINSAGQSEPSGWSNTVLNYGRPGPVRDLQAENVDFGTADSGTGSVKLSWSPPDSAGRDVEYYTVSGPTGSFTVSGTSATVNGITLSGGLATFTVTATNDSSNPAAYTSAPATVQALMVGALAPPSIQSVRPTNQPEQVYIEWSPSPATNGWSSGDIRYEWAPGGGGWAALNGNTLSGNGLVGGTATNIRIRAVGIKNGVEVSSPEVVSGAVTPMTPVEPPVAPAISCRVATATTMRCSWEGGSDGGVGATYALSGSTSGAVEATGSVEFTPAADEILEVCITVTQNGTGATDRRCEMFQWSPASTYSLSVTPGSLSGTVNTYYVPEGQYQLTCVGQRTFADGKVEDGLDLGLGGTVSITRHKDNGFRDSVGFTCNDPQGLTSAPGVTGYKVTGVNVGPTLVSN